MNNYNCTMNPKTTCDNMLYFQDNQLNTFSTMDYCSHLKIRMALAELIYVFSYLNLNQEMPDNKCLFSEKKKSTMKHFNRILIKSPIFRTLSKSGAFLPQGSKFVWDSNFCSWRTIHKICKNIIETQKISYYPAGLSFKP